MHHDLYPISITISIAITNTTSISTTGTTTMTISITDEAGRYVRNAHKLLIGLDCTETNKTEQYYRTR
jgi:hypothetical protein